MMKAIVLAMTVLALSDLFGATPCSALAVLPETPQERLFDCAEGDVDGDGTPEVVMVTTDDELNGIIRIYREKGMALELIGEFTPRWLFGGLPEVELIDFGSDGRYEIVASMESGSAGARAHWIFAWDGKDLNELTPRKAPAAGTMGMPPGGMDFMDIDGDGDLDALKVYGVDEPDPVAGIGDIFVWNEGRFEHRGQLAEWEIFKRHTGPPALEVQMFSIADLSAPYRIRILSGKGTASARITLNGRPIAEPADFKNKPLVKDIWPVQMNAENKIEVVVAGGPDSEIYVLFLKNWIGD